MIDLIMKRGKASQESFAYWVLRSMFSAGKDQWALDYMRKNWGDQTKLGSFNGAWEEGWDLPWGSTSHAWSSGPTALLSQEVLGLEPTGYGWKTFSVKPHPGDLKWAKGTVSTVAGQITAAWDKFPGRFDLRVTIPVNTTATVYLPAKNVRSVTESGKPVEQATGVRFLRQEKDQVVLNVGSGSYMFDSKTR
jgi:alpha-L-rhamnosidase